MDLLKEVLFILFGGLHLMMWSVIQNASVGWACKAKYGTNTLKQFQFFVSKVFLSKLKSMWKISFASKCNLTLNFVVNGVIR